MKYDLMLYDIGSNKQDDSVSFSSAGKLVEDRVSRRLSSLLYGTEKNQPLTFKLVFGASPTRMEKGISYDRFEIEAISSWLTGHDTWKWLKVDQPDMESIRYRCLITELQQISYGGHPWAFSCTVTCDSPYAYRSARPDIYICNSDKTEIMFRNRSSYNGTYYPIVEIELIDSTGIEIINHSDQNRSFQFSDIPASIRKITVDNENKVITTDSEIDVYSSFNFKFLRFVRGDNKLSVIGKCVLKFICDFPVNVGG